MCVERGAVSQWNGLGCSWTWVADRVARPGHVTTVFAEGAVFEGEVPVKEKKMCIHCPTARMTCSFFL